MPSVRKVQVVEYEYEPEGQLPLLTLEEVGVQKPISFERMMVPTFSDEFLLTEDSSTISYRHALDPAPEIDEVLFEMVIEKIPDKMAPERQAEGETLRVLSKHSAATGARKVNANNNVGALREMRGATRSKERACLSTGTQNR